jgi:tetratricopeptide (TPR) repeat protein
MASKSSVVRAVAIAGLVVAVAVAGAGASLGKVGLEVVWFLAIFVVVIPVHELGHALAGALVGFQIRSVIVGVGPPLFTFQVAGVAVRVNVLPLAGATMGIPRRKSWVRLRMWIFAAGGPGANLIVYLILHRFYAHSATLGLGPQSFVSIAAAANWAVLTVNLIPFRTAEGASSDGYSLLTVPFWGRRQVEDAEVAAEGSALTEALRRNDLAAAAPLAAELRFRHPDHPLSALWSGSLLHRQGRHHEARAVWREALTRETEPARIAIIKNDIAFVDALIGDAEGLGEADALSEAALAARPDHPSIAGTRGAVLVRIGRPAEALPLLRRAAAAHGQDGRGQAYNRASLASALAMLGRPDEARRELERARDANPACELLQQSEADLRSAEGRGVAPALLFADEPMARVLGRWGGLVRWQQVARGLAFVYLVAPPSLISTETSPLLIAAMAILLSPEPTGLAVLGACSTWVAVLRALSRAGYGSGDPAPGWQVGLALAFGLGAVALGAVRRHLGTRGPSKAPVLLGCFLGVVALPTFLSVAMKLLHLQSVLRSHLYGVLAPLGPSLSETVALVGLATVWVVGRRRSVRLLALIPAGLIIAAVMSARNVHIAHAGAEALIRNIPAEGAAIVWGDPRPATVLRTRRVSAAGYRATLSPGGARSSFRISASPSGRCLAPRSLREISRDTWSSSRERPRPSSTMNV